MTRRPITTHVLDTSRGKPAAHIPVTLSVFDGSSWIVLDHKVTNEEGRIPDFSVPEFTTGVHKLTFAVQEYLKQSVSSPFFSDIDIAFTVDTPDEHYHVPLILSNYSYSTYRGS